MLQMNQIIISPIHLSAMKAELLQKMMEKRITGISFENLKDDSGTYPIVRSMSEIAGSAAMFTNEGPRIFRRYGPFPPSLTM